MLQTTTWIVVANGSQAKIFKLAKFPKIEELVTMDHPESRMYDQELEGRKPGRNFQSGGTTRHAYEPETDPKEVEIEKFAKTLSDYICAAHYKGEFARLYLMASPSFLGLLRQRINTNTQKAIVAEVAKEWKETGSLPVSFMNYFVRSALRLSLSCPRSLISITLTEITSPCFT